jgi:hypothetical protein
VATLGSSVLVSLVVAVIVGGVVAAVTIMTLASTKPATAPPADQRATPVAPPEPAPVRQEPRSSAVATATRPLPRTRPDADVAWDPDGGRIPWWRRLRAAAGLGVASALLGAVLAALVGVGLLLAALALDRALG